MPAHPRLVRRLAVRRTNYKTKKPGFWVFRVVLLVFVILLAFFSWQVVSSWQKRVWKDGGRFTVVVGTDSPTVYSYSPTDHTLTFFKIPHDTQIENAVGYGSWFVGNLWTFGGQEGKSWLLARSIQKEFGVPTDAWIDGKGAVIFEKKVFDFLPAAYEALRIGRLETNLTFFDRVNLFLAAGTVSGADRREIDLAKSGVIKKTRFSDGVEGFVPISEKTLEVFGTLRDEKVWQEGKTLRIVNTTDTSGLGNDVMRVAQTLGFAVLAVDTEKTLETGICKLVGERKHINSFSAKRIVSIFGCFREEKRPVGPANLEMILGDEFAKNY